MHIIAGLGNPGSQYRFTRHNIGFRVIEELQKRYFAKMALHKTSNSILGKIKIIDRDVILLMPQTYMNNSGMSIAVIKKKFSVRASNIVIIHDEIDLPLGKIKVKFGGGIAGHNGLKSIVENIATKDFSRVRIGIGKPDKNNMSVSSFVLSEFAKEEKLLIEQTVSKAADAAVSIIEIGLEKTMNLFNKS